MKYYIIAGEASGDLHGSNLMKAILCNDPNAQFRFWGGDAMMKIGGTPVRHIKDLAYMGFVEVMLHLRTILGNISFCKKDILTFQPDAIIYIDYPGFNLKIAKWAKKQGFRNYHYISPQLWAWKKGRISAMKRDLDKLYYILPFEQKFYSENSMPQAEYVGHPLMDAVTTELPRSYHEVIALLPGSRKQEIKKMLPMMAQMAERHPEHQFEVAGMTLIGKSFYEKILPCPPRNLTYVFDNTYQLLSRAKAAIVCSGTATLETALFNVPQVVCYKANPISVAIARFFVGKRIKYISLVNLIADKSVITELIQSDFNDGKLEREFELITDNAQHIQKIQEGYDFVKILLKEEGASDRVAKSIINSLIPPHNDHQK